MRPVTAPIALLDDSANDTELPPSELAQRVSELEAELAALKGRSAQVQSVIDGLPDAQNAPDKLSMVVYSADLDRLLATMIIATGAAAMGMQVNLFFTFWATSSLRNGAFRGKRPLIERMFGWMLPKGRRSLKLSQMHMGGMGTAMIKWRMRDKNVSDLDELFEMAKEMGVKINICEMSMDLLGMKLDDLMDYPDMEVCGVATFLSHAMDSKVTLFI